MSIGAEAMIETELDVLRDVSRRLDAYRQEEFARRRQINLGDFETWIGA